MTIWDYYPYKASTFLGEILIDLYGANLDDELVWYPITDHDENSSPLPPVSPKHSGKKQPAEKKMSGSNSDRERRKSGEGGDRQPWNSLPVLPATPAHDKAKELLHKRILPSKHLP